MPGDFCNGLKFQKPAVVDVLLEDSHGIRVRLHTIVVGEGVEIGFQILGGDGCFALDQRA